MSEDVLIRKQGRGRAHNVDQAHRAQCADLGDGARNRKALNAWTDDAEVKVGTP